MRVCEPSVSVILSQLQALGAIACVHTVSNLRSFVNSDTDLGLQIFSTDHVSHRTKRIFKKSWLRGKKVTFGRIKTFDRFRERGQCRCL